jgi:hypothetical protein
MHEKTFSYLQSTLDIGQKVFSDQSWMDFMSSVSNVRALLKIKIVFVTIIDMGFIKHCKLVLLQIV